MKFVTTVQTVHTYAKLLCEFFVDVEQMIHTDSGATCGANDTNFLSDGTTSTFRVLFKEPVEIQPNQSYTACATLKVKFIDLLDTKI